jgi:site-specific recombinase XerD
MNYLIWLSNGRKNKKGLSTLYIRVTKDGIRQEYSTEIRILEKNWDKARKKITGKNSLELNLQLEKKYDHIKQHYQSTIIDNAQHGSQYAAPEGKCTLKQLYAKFYQYKTHRYNTGNITKRTLDKVEYTLSHFVEQYDVISDENIDSFKHTLITQKGYSVSYFNTILEKLKEMMRYGVSKGYISHSPIAHVKSEKQVGRQIKHLDPTQYKKLLDTPSESEYWDLAKIQLLSGLAYADINTLTAEHIVMKNNCPFLVKNREKTDIESIIPITPQLMAIFNKYPNGIPRYTNQPYNRELKKIGNKLGHHELVSHTLRKTFGMVMLNNGYSIEAVSRMMGHSNIKTTQKWYAKMNIEGIYNELRKVA